MGLHSLDEMTAKHVAVTPAALVNDLVLLRWGGDDRAADDLAASAKALVNGLAKMKLKVAAMESGALASNA
eukprot:5529630-Pyramimonas_sp.AAC.1